MRVKEGAAILSAYCNEIRPERPLSLWERDRVRERHGAASVLSIEDTIRLEFDVTLARTA